MNIAIQRFRERIIDREIVKPDAMIGMLGTQHTREILPDMKSLRVTAMTDRIALDRLVVVPRGCDTSYIDQNKRVFLDHNTDIFSCVGSIRDYSIGDHGIQANIALAESHEDYGQLMALAGEVGIGTSIGFEILEMTGPKTGDPPHYRDAEGVARRWRWLELSLTMMPSDVYAQAEGIRCCEPMMMRSVARMAQEGRIGARLVRRLGLTLPQKRKVSFTAKKP